MPQVIIDAFSAETGVSVEYIGYDTLEEGLTGLELGANYDLMIIVNSSLLSGEHVVALGRMCDAFDTQVQNENIAYIIPTEGTILWFDNFVIPVISSNKVLAECFIDFVLQPEMSALVTNELAVATGNETAYPLIDPALSNNPAVFPSGNALQNAERELLFDPTTQAIHNIRSLHISKTVNV
ncbi:extracellular solute-binding protein [Chloroflexus sp.]|uniref:extracellular solute-binding protein n=1 Tax=Chloroflexus sp. TaxID=1904827 RepID=UPI004049F46A